MKTVKKTEVYQVLSKALNIPIKELEQWNDEQLRQGIRKAHKLLTKQK